MAPLLKSFQAEVSVLSFVLLPGVFSLWPVAY